MSDEVSRRGFLRGVAAAGASAALAPALARAAEAPAGKSAWQIGCFTRPWHDQPYTVAFDAIAEAGFKYVGFMTTKMPGGYIITINTPVEVAAKAGEQAAQRGLTPIAAWGGGLPVRKSVEEGVTALRKLIDQAEAAKVPTLLMGGTTVKAEYSDYYKAIAECCDYAAGKKVALVIKPHGGLNSTGEQCKKTVEMVGKPDFHLWYDPGNIYYYSNGKLDPADDAKTVNGVVSGMCVKDFKPPKNVDVQPGEGEVKFKAVMQALRAGGFTSGPLVVETLGPVTDPKERIAAAKKAREFVESLVGKAGADRE
jgi:sugar phosphate isomerase/epimerase